MYIDVYIYDDCLSRHFIRDEIFKDINELVVYHTGNIFINDIIKDDCEESSLDLVYFKLSDYNDIKRNARDAKYYYDNLLFSKGRVFSKTLKEEAGRVKIYYNDGKMYQKNYYNNNKVHKEDGPAVLFYGVDGVEDEFYYLNGEGYSREEWERAIMTKLYW